MLEFAKRHKKPCIIAGIILVVIILIVYLKAVFAPGLWHGNAFLYLQKDGSFEGSDIYAQYKMKLKSARYGADIDFSVNGKTNYYQLKYDKGDLNRNIEVLKNGTSICKGRAIGIENNYFVIDDKTGSSDIVRVRVGNEVPKADELYPGCSQLYNWSVGEKYDRRGDCWMLFIIALLAIVLFLDIKFPMLFWLLEHRLDVDGGEPSDLYLFGQKVGRILMFIGIPVCMVLTFILR